MQAMRQWYVSRSRDRLVLQRLFLTHGVESSTTDNSEVGDRRAKRYLVCSCGINRYVAERT